MKDLILKEVARYVIPCIQLFGLYIVFFGHISPGGGFSGGTIIGVSFILLEIIFKDDPSVKKIPIETLLKTMALSLILYGLIKSYSFYGAYYHWPHPPAGTPGEILSGGFILPLNLLVGIIVAVVIYTLYCVFEKGEF